MDKEFIENPVEAYEKLKQEVDVLKAKNRELKAVHSTNVALSDELFKYKAEYEKLKKCRELAWKLTASHSEEISKLKAILTEIKEVVQFGDRPYKLCGEYNDCCDVLNKIWNKISEVDDE